jgi:hypothetical protein
MNHGLLFALSALTAVTSSTPTPEPKAPVAIVYALSGEAFQGAPGQPRHPIVLFDQLPAGADLDVEPGARLALAFASGKCWALGGGARATLGATDLGSRAGNVRRLPSVPPLPRLAPIRKDDHAGPRAGAVRIRGERIKGLYPGRGAKALASATVLRFRAAGGAERYRVEVQDEQGAIVVSTETTAPAVRVPAGILRPGASYHWVVRTLDLPGAAARGEADFPTLDRESAWRRERLRRAAAGRRELTALLAGIDRQLGVLAEARDELRSALAASPGDPALGAVLAAVERDLAEDTEETSGTETGVVVEAVALYSLGALAGPVPHPEQAGPAGVPELERRPSTPRSSFSVNL